MRTWGLFLIACLLAVACEPAFADERTPTGDDTTIRRNDNALVDVRRPECCCLRDQRCGWTFSVGGLYLGRLDSDDAPVLIDTVTNMEALNGEDFDYGFAPGIEVGITRHRIRGNIDLELKGFFVGDWEDDRDIAFLDDPDLATNPNFNVPNVGPVTSDITSNLASLEINARWRCSSMNCVRWLVGLRCLSFEEEMNLRFVEVGATTRTYDVEAENLMCGVQVGADFDIVSKSCFCVRGFLKGGLFYNQAEHTSALAQAGQTIWSVDEEDEDIAFMVEGGIGVDWCANSCLTITAEYRVMWIDGLALAPDQTSATNINPAAGTASGIDTDGSVILHGPYIGVALRF